MDRDAVVSEVFGPTWQGEGPNAGRLCKFVRFGLCNLDCVWCDTPWTWDFQGRNGEAFPRSALKHVPLGQLLELLDGWQGLVVVTGGEPLLQPAAVKAIADHLPVQVETNGTRLAPADLAAEFVISPKLANAALTHPSRGSVADGWVEREPWWKFVCSTREDVDAAAAFCDGHGVPYERVFIMPEGRSSTAVLDTQRALADYVLAAGFNLSTRLHVLLWEDRRGV